MKIESPAFVHNEEIPKDYTADGENINPPLKISEIPEGTQSLVLICEDPDARRCCGYTWIHWVVFDIPVEGDSVEIKENSIPGTPGESTYKKPFYGGPNPPAGTGAHHYHFKVYALDKKLNLPEMTSLEKIKEVMENHILESSDLIGIYSKN